MTAARKLAASRPINKRHRLCINGSAGVQLTQEQIVERIKQMEAEGFLVTTDTGCLIPHPAFLRGKY